MKIIKRLWALALPVCVVLLPACSRHASQDLAARIQHNEAYTFLKAKSREVVKSGFNAGDGYGEVWIRDYNTFIELSAEVFPAATLRDNLLVFLKLQGADGNIVDGFIPKEKAGVGYAYRYSELAPQYAGHKNTVETDQESSLVQAVYKYIKATHDTTILQAYVGDSTVLTRLEHSLQYLMAHRYNKQYGLLYGATTADWGDVQPEHTWGVYLTDDTHYAIDIYDNAMFLIALDNIMAMAPASKQTWVPVRDSIAGNARKYLWDATNKKFIPHLYLNGSPFPAGFNENAIYYHGGTAVAIEAGLLSREEVAASLQQMVANVKASGAPTIGLTLYPPYPAGTFANTGMHPYGYQNGGDWDWFGGRMIQQLVRYGFVEAAVEQLQPMINRARANNGFYEWYSVTNEPKGSGTFRGSAGVLYKAVRMLEDWAAENGVAHK